jgi:hypothetical protein
LLDLPPHTRSYIDSRKMKLNDELITIGYQFELKVLVSPPKRIRMLCGFIQATCQDKQQVRQTI